MDLVKHLMQPDTFNYYCGFVDNSQRAADQKWTNTLLSMVHKKVAPVAGELQTVLQAFDSSGSGMLSRHDLLAGCASLGIVLSEKEMDTLLPLLQRNDRGEISYSTFCEIFS